MLPEKLKQIDTRLIELLRDRLSILAQSEMPNLEEQVSAVAPLLADAGIPEQIWKSVLTSSMGAIATSVAAVESGQTRKVTIIGGSGRMGKFFTEELSAAGHQVSSLGRNDWERADILLGEADLVIVSVSIEQTEAAIARAAKYLAPTTALADITSIKTGPVQAMMQHHTGPVMGLHPMFGPRIKSFSEQKVVVCPGRQDEAFQWFLDFLKSKGAKLILSTPEEHDRMMVVIQATQHFSRFCLGLFLAAENIDIGRSLLMSSPSYRQEIEIVNRLFAQSPALCADIILATEERCQAIERLANTYNRLAQIVAKKDRTALIEEFEATQSFFTDNSIQPVKERNYAVREYAQPKGIAI